jgi:hypothetical protein
VVVTVLLFVVWPDHEQQRCYHYAPSVKPEAATTNKQTICMMKHGFANFKSTRDISFEGI